MLSFVIFFFKHMTAYEMRISDWSSDVCSSDLSPRTRPREVPLPMERLLRDIEPDRGGREDRADEDEDRPEQVDPEFIPRAGVEHEVAHDRKSVVSGKSVSVSVDLGGRRLMIKHNKYMTTL